MGAAKLSFETKSYGATDVGRRRKANEDAFLCDDALGLWVVADGMGGHAAGEVASNESIDTIMGMVKREKGMLSGKGAEADLKVAARLLEGAIQAATYLVYAMAELDSQKAGMGTTISAAMSYAGQLVLAQVGDSRIYRVRGNQAEQLTEDHTLVSWQIKQGLITEDQAKVSRQRNVITRAVGNKEYVQVDTMVLPLQLGDVFLLCSDGLHGYLRLDEIPEFVSGGGAAAVERLIAVANKRGGKDNITVIYLEIS